MKKTFDIIKQIFIDNKEYFIKCTLMSIIAAFILVLAISFVVPASAADDPTESHQVLIPAGVYRWNDKISNIPSDIEVSLNFTTNRAFTEDYSNSLFEFYEGITTFNLIQLDGDIRYGQVSSSSSGSATSYYTVYSPIQEIDGQVVGWDWDTLGELSKFLGLNVIGDYTDFGQIITISQDTNVADSFGTWFFANTSSVFDPDQYIIAQGSYYLSTPTNLPFELYDDGDFFFQSGGSRFSSLRNDTIAIIYGNNVTNTPRRVYTFVGENQGYNDFTLRSITLLKDFEVTETTYNNFFASYKAVDESDEYQAGYEAGYNEGSSSGYDQGYQDGLNASAGSSDTFLGSIIEGVVDALDKLVIIGDFSVLDIIKTVIGGFVVVFLLKLIAGG